MNILKGIKQGARQAVVFSVTLFYLLGAHAEVRPQMQNFYRLIDKIHQYILDKTTYMEKSNEKEIAATLKEFNVAVANLKKEKSSSEDDMKFRVRQLEEGLAEAEQSFKDKS